MIIGFIGKAGAGKDLALHLLREENPNWQKIAFADPLREICSIAFGLTPHEMADRELKEAPLTRWPNESPRHLLQTVGTNLFRHRWENVWIEAWKRRVAASASPCCVPADVIATDVRFNNEAETIKSIGGHLVRISRPSLISDDIHPSEIIMESIKADKEVVNDGSVALFKARLLLTVAELEEGR